MARNKTNIAFYHRCFMYCFRSVIIVVLCIVLGRLSSLFYVLFYVGCRRCFMYCFRSVIIVVLCIVLGRLSSLFYVLF